MKENIGQENNRNIIEKLQEMLKTVETHIIRWVIYSALGAIVTAIGVVYSLNNKVEAHDKILPKLETKLDNVVTVPVIQTEQIKDIKRLLIDLNNRQVISEQKYDNRLNRMEQRQDDIYNKILDLKK
jgi:hypothetical protein